MTIYRGNFVHKFDYTINGNVLYRVDVVRDLGIYFDSCWTFDNHIEFITSKASKLIRFIKRTTFKFRSIAAVAYLDKSLVLPQLLYVSVIWHPYTANKFSKLESTQKSFYDMLLTKREFYCPLAIMIIIFQDYVISIQ